MDRKELIFRHISEEDKTRLKDASSKIVDFMVKTLKLEKWECFFLIKTMYDSLPVDYIKIQRVYDGENKDDDKGSSG